MKKITLIIGIVFVFIMYSITQQVQARMVQDDDNSYRYFEDDLDIIQVSLGYFHSSALTKEGRLFTWGYNLNGELGDGTTSNRYTPTNITRQFDLFPGETIIDVSLGFNHSSALTSEGRLFTWGNNETGRLGDGTTTSRSTPTEITGQFDLINVETSTEIS